MDLVAKVWPPSFMLLSLFINFVLSWFFTLSEVECPSMSFVKLDTWSFKIVVSIGITNKVPRPEALFGYWHEEVSIGELLM